MRFIRKLFAYLLAGILTLVVWAFEILGIVLSFIGVFVILLFVICLIVIAVSGLLDSLPTVICLLAVCYVIFGGTAYLSGVIRYLRDKLINR